MESANWNDDKVAVQRFAKEEERVEQAYKKEQEKLNILYEQQKESDNHAITYIKNEFANIHDLGCAFLSLLDNYFPIEKEKTPKDIKPTITSGLYFDMKLVSAIHHECNNIQFENLSEIDFYALLNLQPCNSRLKVKDRECVRVCYLIYKLYEYLKTKSRVQWRSTILTLTGIKEDYYNSKYKVPVSELPSRENERFARRIDEIFKNIS